MRVDSAKDRRINESRSDCQVSEDGTRTGRKRKSVGDQPTWFVWDELDRTSALPPVLRTLVMQLLDTPTAIRDKVQQLLCPIIRSTPGDSVDRSLEE